MVKHAATGMLWDGLLIAVRDIFYLWLAMLLYYLLSLYEMCPGG